MRLPGQSAEKSIRVRILDRDFGLRVTEDNEVATREIAAYVDAKMRAFRRAHPDQPELTAAIVTALGIAEELFSTWEDRDEAVQSLNQEFGVLDQYLAAALEPAEQVEGQTSDVEGQTSDVEGQTSDVEG